MLRLTALAATVMVLTALPARADEVRLKNGDRITGNTVSLVSGTLTFKPDLGGEMKIPWSEVTSLAVDNPVYVTVADAPPVLTAFDAADAQGYVTLMPGGPVLLTDIIELSPRYSSWERAGGAGAGFVQTAGNTQISNVRVSADLMLKGGSNRYTVNGAATRAKDRGVETARNWSGTAKYDRFITERIFADVNAVLANDRFRDIDLRAAYGAGAGMQLIAAPRVKLTGDGGVGVVSENFISIPDDRYTAAFESGDLKIDVVPGRAQLFHLHDGYYQITQGDKMFFRTQNGLRFSIAGGFVATLQEDFDYDRRPSPGRKQTDTTFAFTLGYRF